MEQLTLTKPRGGICFLRLRKLYHNAFPREERKPFSIICKMYREGKNDIWCIRLNGKLMGLATTVNGEREILLDYLAVMPGHRGKGIGSRALEELKKIYQGKGIIAEIESSREDCPDRERRLVRKQFYVNSGLEPMDVEAEVFGVRMELLGFNCRLSFREYRQFYHDYNSPWAAKHIKPLDGEDDR